MPPLCWSQIIGHCVESVGSRNRASVEVIFLFTNTSPRMCERLSDYLPYPGATRHACYTSKIKKKPYLTLNTLFITAPSRRDAKETIIHPAIERKVR